MATDKSVMIVIRASRPSFKNANDKVAFAVHASFVASGYLLNSTGPPALHDSAFTSSSTDEVGIDRWNEIDDEYVFVYLNPDNGLKKTLVKCLGMNNTLQVDAVAHDKSEPVHIGINVNDHVTENYGPNYTEHFKNLDKLVEGMNKEILSKLECLLAGNSSCKTGSSQSREDPRDYPDDYSLANPHGHRYPSPESLYPGSGGDMFGDLYPGPVAGVYPTRGNFAAGGSMFVGPNDPRWFGGGSGTIGFSGERQSVPPGARFDPYGPPDVPGFEPNRFARNPRRPGRGHHPDLEHFSTGSDF